MDRPAFNFSRISGFRSILISAALVVPCFWLPIVSGNDLQSHLYNAWLATLIENGSIHGLWIGHQSTNVLTDLLLSWLLKTFGVSVAERVVCCAAVLIFFWGAFRFISAVRGQATYWLAPWLAVFSYGYVFQAGLLNYYLACGIVFWVLAAYWKGGIGWWAVAAIPLLFLAFLAHPMPVLWLIGIVGYCWIAKRISIRFQVALFLVCGAALLVIRLVLSSRYMTDWTRDQLIFATGIDQVLLRGWHYLPVALGLLLFCVILLFKSENLGDTLTGVSAQAYFLTAAAIVVIPTAIRSSTYSPSASLIADRLSLLSAVLLLALLSYSPFRRWYLYAALAGAAIFFCSLYVDVSGQARTETKIASLVAAVPADARVVQLVGHPPQGTSSLAPWRSGLFKRFGDRLFTLCCSRLSADHLLSRACVGQCFDFANYEPATGQFRIHPEPGNAVVMSTYYEVGSIAVGNFEIKTSYLPLYGLIRCGRDRDELSIRPLVAGETQATVVCPGFGTQQ